MSRQTRSRRKSEVATTRRMLPGHFGPRGKAKRSFETKDAARVFADRMNAAEPDGKNRVAYRCGLCGRFHVGKP